MAESWLLESHRLDVAPVEPSASDTAAAALIADLNTTLMRQPGTGQAAVVMGCLAAALGLSEAATLDALAFSASRDMVAAAIRLNLIGPMRAVQLQAALGRAAEAFPVHGARAEEAAGSAPLLEAAHAGHSLLEMRLFQT